MLGGEIGGEGRLGCWSLAERMLNGERMDCWLWWWWSRIGVGARSGPAGSLWQDWSGKGCDG